ncbi:MAG: hypothetical protein M1837_000466 [Sclerophora amabilis]|nr:MAG: hypothetical protein M1837_000466 [Sclerophora amabilis]
MADQALAEAILAAAGFEASSILQSSLQRCYYSRYTWRSRSEQLLGDIADVWKELRSEIQRANRTMNQLGSAISQQRLDRELQQAARLSDYAIGSLTKGVPTVPMMRSSEKTERYLETLARDVQLPNLIRSMQAAIWHLAQVAASVKSNEGTRPKTHKSAKGRLIDGTVEGFAVGQRRARPVYASTIISPPMSPIYEDSTHVYNVAR